MIEIFAVTYNGQPAAASVRGAFGPEGGTLGRSPENRLALPDPARHVSRIQAKVRWDGARYWIANTSEANPLFLNDEEVESGRERPIVPGDELRVGLYVLRVRTPVGPPIDYRPAGAGSGAEQTIGANTGAARIAAPGAPPAPVSIDGLLGVGGEAASPFADLLGGSVPIGSSPPASSAAAADPLRDLLAPATAPASPAPSPGRAPATGAGDPFAGLIGTPVTPTAPGAPMEPFAAAPPAAPTPRATANADPFAALAPPSAANPFGDLLGPSSSGPPPAGHRRPDGPVTHIPQDFNPFAAPAAPARNTADPLAELAKNSIDLDALSGEKRPSLVDFDPSAKVDPRDALRGGTPSLVDPLQAVDPMKLFGGGDDKLISGHAALPAGGRPMRDDFAELGANFTPPRALTDPHAPVRGQAGAPSLADPVSQSALLADVPAPAVAPGPIARPASAGTPLIGDASIGMRAPAPAPRPAGVAAPTPATSQPLAHPAAPPPVIAQQPSSPVSAPHAGMQQAAPSASTAALLAAFLEGANAQALNVQGGLTPDMMRTMGRLVYHAVAGAMTLISARQITKREMGAEVTMIVPKGNNPLKFLPTPEAALMQILGPKMPGFMSSVDAMQDAFDDLRAHEVGVIAGTRAALSAVLRRFDPKALEERLGSGGLFDSLVPATRRAKLWAAFENQFNEVYREAEEDFNKLFGEAFIRAYEAEVARHRPPR